MIDYQSSMNTYEKFERSELFNLGEWHFVPYLGGGGRGAGMCLKPKVECDKPNLAKAQNQFVHERMQKVKFKV